MKVFSAGVHVKELLPLGGGAEGNWRPSLRHVVYVLLFLCSWALFFAYGYGYRLLEAKFVDVLNKSAAQGIQVGSPVLEGLIPELSARSVALHLENVDLVLEEVRVVPSLFPLSFSLTCRVAGGTLSATLTPASMLAPFPCQVQGALTNLSLPELLSSLRNALPVRIEAGRIDVQADLSVTRSTRRLDALAGSVSLTLTEGKLQHDLPIVRVRELAPVRGRAAIRLVGGNVNMETLSVEADDMALEASGRLRPGRQLKQTRLDVRAMLTVPKTRVELELLPPRTRQQIEQHGRVSVRLGGTAGSPSLSLMEQ